MSAPLSAMQKSPPWTSPSSQWAPSSQWSLEPDGHDRAASRRAELRAACAHPLRQRDIRGPDGRLTLAGASRLLARDVEDKLRACERFRPWHFDPALDLSLIRDGLPVWSDGYREDSGESAAEFKRITNDYIREMERGAIFPPLLVMEVRPEHDRKALHPLLHLLVRVRCPPAVPFDHYGIINGRHRAMAAHLLGRAAHPAFVWGSWGEYRLPERGQLQRWAADVTRLEAEVAEAAATGRQRGTRFTGPQAPELQSALAAP